VTAEQHDQTGLTDKGLGSKLDTTRVFFSFSLESLVLQLYCHSHCGLGRQRN